MAEFFQNVWSLLTTENYQLIQIIAIPLCYIENLVTILLFSTIFKISEYIGST